MGLSEKESAAFMSMPLDELFQWMFQTNNKRGVILRVPLKDGRMIDLYRAMQQNRYLREARIGELFTDDESGFMCIKAYHPSLDVVAEGACYPFIDMGTKTQEMVGV
jgi:hypothetical protein